VLPGGGLAAVLEGDTEASLSEEAREAAQLLQQVNRTGQTAYHPKESH